MGIETQNISMQKSHKGLENIQFLLSKKVMARGLGIKLKWQTQL